ncbi:MAG: Asparagine synthase [Massilia sp.]|nr:Asparagine synthase [Massilia sp.]
MSGLCGWFSHDPAALPIEQMAAPLCRFDQAALRVGEHGAGMLALAAGIGDGSMLHEDGLLVAAWGEPADTVARLWRSHGAKACSALSGSFVFALLDERRDEALLAVDRSGARPLYYQQVGRTLVFATSAEALVQHPGAGREIDPQALYNYLYFHGVPAPASIYKGQRRLLAGESLHLQGGRLSRARYWKLQFHETLPAGGPDLKQELVDTVRSASAAESSHAQGGVLLSGGLASAAVAALLAGAGDAPVRTYSVAYEGADAALARARALARQIGTVHRERTVSAAEVAEAIPLLAAGFDQPLGDPAALATFYCAALARDDGVQRLLGGHGAAELFGARLLYSQQARLSQYEKIPSALRQTLVEPLLFQLAGGVRAAGLRRARSYIEQAMAGLPGRLEAANLLHGYGSAEVLEAGFLAGVDPTAPAALLSQSWWLADGASQVNQLIALDLKYALADLRLPAAAAACQLSGLEARFPFMADAVVAFAARLAPQQKLDGVRTSPFFRDALRALVPRKALPPRSATLPPFGHWLQADPRLRSLALDSLSDLKRRAIVRPAFIDSLLVARMAERAPHYGTMVWLLMMLEQWLGQRRFVTVHTPLIRRTEDAAETCRQ